MEKVVVTVDRHANTSAASIPLALDEAVRDGRIRPGQHVLLEARRRRLHLGRGPGRNGAECATMKFAFVFPGQGSQSVGMMAPFERFRAVRATFAEAASRSGRTCGRWSRDGPAEELNTTVNTQPVMLTAGVRGVSRVAGSGRGRARSWSPATAWANTRRWSRPARSHFAMRCRWCGSARRPCRKRCRWARARWPRSSDWTTMRCARRAARRRRARSWRRSISTRPSQVVIAGHKAAVRARRSRRPRRAAPSARCCCR